MMHCDLNEVLREETLRDPWAGNQEPAPRPAQPRREQKAEPALGYERGEEDRSHPGQGL